MAETATTLKAAKMARVMRAATTVETKARMG